ncbi:TrkH family potassium uptake protein [Candidatus Mycalebacterium sp.]
MNFRFCLNILGSFIRILGLLMLIPAACSLIYGEDDLFALVSSAAIIFVFGFVLILATRGKGKTDEIERRDGFLIAVLFWVSASLLGSIPYLLYGVFPNPVDALFESTAGFTTTGASVIHDIEVLPHGILLWRNLSQWLGGMGIVVLAIAVLPRLSIGGGRLMALEAPGPTTERLTPRIAETAKNIWLVYVALSVLLAIILALSGMSVFDSITHSFSTMSTGGFSPNNMSIGHYGSPLIEAVITVFMFIAGINFVVHYLLMKGKFRDALKGKELKFYFLFMAVMTVIVCINLNGTGTFDSLGESFRYAAFQVVSIGTTTGYSSADFGSWPALSTFLLIILMVAGGCSGSTSGAVKQSRILVMAAKCYRELRKLIYPSMVSPVRFDGKPLEEAVVSNVASFLLLYAFGIIIGTGLITSLENISLLAAFSATVSAIGNVGPGFGALGPSENYAALADSTKGVLSLLMITGRLELYTILVLFIPDFWRR